MELRDGVADGEPQRALAPTELPQELGDDVRLVEQLAGLGVEALAGAVSVTAEGERSNSSAPAIASSDRSRLESAG